MLIEHRLAVRLYDDLDEALDYINANERPLGLYVYGDDMKTNEHVLANTNSGGCCVNAAAVQGALVSFICVDICERKS